MDAEKGIALSGHREQDFSNDVGKTPDTESIMQIGNFFTIINEFSTLDTVLTEHLERVKHFMKHFIRKI